MTKTSFAWGSSPWLMAALLASAQTAHAQALDLIDPNFSICAYGTSNVSSCGPTDPQRVTSAGVSIGVIGNAGAGPLNGFLVFAAVPDLPTPAYPGSPAAAPTFGSMAGFGYSIAAASSKQFGQTTNVGAGGYLGELTSSDIYTFAGLQGGNNSFNFPNMSGFGLEKILHGGVAPTSFSIYEFIVTVTDPTLFASGSNLKDSNVYNLPFASVGAGTYVAAWGADANPLVNGTAVYDSAFTVGGFVVSRGSVPEPDSGMLAALALGLLGAGYWTRRKI